MATVGGDILGLAMLASATDWSCVLHTQRSTSRKTIVDELVMPSTSNTAGPMAVRFGSMAGHIAVEERAGSSLSASQTYRLDGRDSDLLICSTTNPGPT